MGQVWLAEQREPLKRRVALKLVKLGMDTKEFVARFESERQALALMDHPSIARVIDGGATETGRPYFVMEYVEGVPITAYCDEHHLTIEERLKLFIEVCEGVQHAHHKGIIHRDLKPSNVLICEVDGKPVPKIIDFGVAKAMTQSLTDKTLQTVLGGWIGTPAYMSPEQAEITDDVDTRTDVYSLGVMLYELLTGLRPLDGESLAGIEEVRRVIREVEPLRPSARVSAATARTAADSRQAQPRSLVKSLRGDLDRIVMKALEKETKRRYGSAAELAADIGRHLSSQPVLAAPPSRTYRARKFVRRHKIGVAASAAGGASLVVAVVGTSIGLVRARAEAERAKQEKRKAEQVSDFLVDLFKMADPEEARGETVTAREVLQRGTERLERELGDQPLVQARLRDAIGTVYRSLGLYQEAAPLLREALQQREQLLGPEHLEVLASLYSLGNLYRSQARYEEAERLYERALAIAEKTYGPEHEKVAAHVNNLAMVYRFQGKNQEAGRLFRRAVEIAEREFPPDHPNVGRAQGLLARLYRSQGRYEEAERLYQRSLRTLESALGPDHPHVTKGLATLAHLYGSQGKYEDAEPLLRRALEIAEKVLPPNHPDVGVRVASLASLYSSQGNHEEAERLYRRALEILEEALGPEHPTVAMGLYNLGDIYTSQDKYERAEPLYRRALAISEKAFGREHLTVAACLGGLGWTSASRGRHQEAEELYQRSLATSEKVEDPEQKPWVIAGALHGLANLYRDQQRHDDAAALYRRALGIREKSRAGDHPGLMKLKGDYAALLRVMGREDEAEQLVAGENQDD